jgi:hypothetical protein
MHRHTVDPRRFLLTLALIPVLVLATSCALSVQGPTQSIPFDSNPQGAEIYLDGELLGVTPITLELSRGSGYTLLVRLGDQEREVIITNAIDGGALVLDVIPFAAAVILVVASPCGSEGWTDLCTTAQTIVIGAGAVASGIPLVIDVASGAAYDLLPREVMIDFDSEDASPPTSVGESEAGRD